MIEFSPDIMDCVRKLRERYASKRYCVVVAYPIIEIIKYSRNKGIDTEISTKLFYSPEAHAFEIQASDYKYYNKISYYDYDRTERRWTRNMNHLFPLIRDLKLCGLWEYISNKNMLVLNQYNSTTDEKKRKKMLDMILSDES